MQDLKITAFQADLIWENTDENLSRFTEKIIGLEEIPDVIVLPEMFNTGFVMDAERVAETISGDTIKWMSDMASRFDCVIAGSVNIYDNGSFYNRFVWMQPDGFFHSYDKRHLFRMGGEHENFHQGNNSLIIPYKGWKIKPLICYDLRFPVWSKNNYRDDVYDYDILIYVANWPAARTEIWKTLLKARAFENQACVVGVNRIGKDGNGLDHSGASVILNAKGQAIADAGEDNETIINATLSYQELYDFREKFKVGLDWDRFAIEE
jgi:predicted amidohydrolase